MHALKGLAEFNGKEVDVVVTMGCGDECPLVTHLAETLTQRRSRHQNLVAARREK